MVLEALIGLIWRYGLDGHGGPRLIFGESEAGSWRSLYVLNMCYIGVTLLIAVSMFLILNADSDHLVCKSTKNGG